jgi:hypothetical protein
MLYILYLIARSQCCHFILGCTTADTATLRELQVSVAFLQPLVCGEACFSLLFVPFCSGIVVTVVVDMVELDSSSFCDSLVGGGCSTLYVEC